MTVQFLSDLKLCLTLHIHWCDFITGDSGVLGFIQLLLAAFYYL